MTKTKVKTIKATVSFLLMVFCIAMAMQSFGIVSIFECEGIFGLRTLDAYVGIKFSAAGIMCLLHTIMASFDAYMCARGQEWLVD